LPWNSESKHQVWEYRRSYSWSYVCVSLSFIASRSREGSSSDTWFIKRDSLLWWTSAVGSRLL